MTQADEGRIGSLLDEVAELHHCVYRITDGVDDDYASWYADWLLNLSELPDLLASRPVRSHLVHELVLLDRDLTFDGSDEHGRSSMNIGCLNASIRTVEHTCPASAVGGSSVYYLEGYLVRPVSADRCGALQHSNTAKGRRRTVSFY